MRGCADDSPGSEVSLYLFSEVAKCSGPSVFVLCVECPDEPLEAVTRCVAPSCGSRRLVVGGVAASRRVRAEGGCRCVGPSSPLTTRSGDCRLRSSVSDGGDVNASALGRR